MKLTFKKFAHESGLTTKIIRAVVNQLGYTSINNECQCTLKDIAKCGIGGGFGGFIYYSETHKFFKKHKKQILQILIDDARDCGVDPHSFIKSFSCVTDDEDTDKEIYSALYGRSSQSQITNALAWYAAEKVAYAFDNIINQ